MIVKDNPDAPRILRFARPNVLIVGPDVRARAVVDRLSPCFGLPLHRCVLPGRLILPAACGGTLLLLNIEALEKTQQLELLRWLDENGDWHVVSVSSIGLFALVERGMFDERLYYRLNIVFEDLEPSEAFVDRYHVSTLTAPKQ